MRNNWVTEFRKVCLALAILIVLGVLTGSIINQFKDMQLTKDFVGCGNDGSKVNSAHVRRNSRGVSRLSDVWHDDSTCREQRVQRRWMIHHAQKHMHTRYNLHVYPWFIPEKISIVILHIYRSKLQDKYLHKNFHNRVYKLHEFEKLGKCHAYKHGVKDNWKNVPVAFTWILAPLREMPASVYISPASKYNAFASNSP